MKAQALPLDLPDYIEVRDDDAPRRYFLTLNRSAKGNWSAAYKEYENHEAICYINDADTLEEIATRLEHKLERYHKAFPDHRFVTVPDHAL